MSRTAVIGCSLALLIACGASARVEAPAVAPSVAAPPAPGAETSIDDRAARLHGAAIVVDTHSDVTQRLVLEGADLGARLEGGHVDVPRMRDGGLDAEFLSIWGPHQLYPGDRAHDYATEQLAAVEQLVRAHPELVLATTSAEVRAAAAAGKSTFLLGLEGGHMLGDATDEELLARLKAMRERGVRYMTLTWTGSNRIGGSSGDDGATRGLSPFGRRVVAAMNDLGIVVDVSHVSDATFADVMNATERPVLASHSSARALSPHPRNMTDDMLRAVGDNGGAVCVNFGPQFLDAEWQRAYEALQSAALQEIMASLSRDAPPDPKVVMREVNRRFDEIARQLPDVPASLVVDHIEHVAKTAGIDHVCLGSDFDGIPKGPRGLDDVSKMPFITVELIRRGYSDQDVLKILGENVLRVLAANAG